MAKKNNGSVSWYLPKISGGYQARAFAHSTTSVADAMRILAEDGYTFASAIPECHYWVEERELCQAFVDAGFGDEFIRDHVR